MTNLDRATNSQKVIDAELGRLKDLAYRGYATVTAAAGKQVPYKYNGLADPTYLNKSSPFYNGGTEEASPDNSGGPIDLRSSKDPDGDYGKLPSGATFIAPDGQHRRKPSAMGWQDAPLVDPPPASSGGKQTAWMNAPLVNARRLRRRQQMRQAEKRAAGLDGLSHSASGGRPQRLEPERSQ